MAEGSALRAEADIVPRERPAVGHFGREIPAPAAILVRAGEEFAIRLPVGLARTPHRLRFGADETELSESLQLAAKPAVEQRVIGPGLADHQLRVEAQLRHQRVALAEM